MAVRRITTLQGPTLKADDGTTAATIADSTGQITVGATDGWTLPTARGADGYVLSQTEGDGSWVEIALAPTITALNWYSDSGYSEALTAAESINIDDATYLKVIGTNLGSAISWGGSAYIQILNVTTGNTVVGHNNNGLTGCITATSRTSDTEVKLTINPSGLGTISAGNSLQVKSITAGGEDLFTTQYVVSADPTSVTTVSSATVANGATVGTFGGLVAGGGGDSNTNLLLNFDRRGGTDFEDSSNTSAKGHHLSAGGTTIIKSSPFGDGKSAMYFDGTDDYLEIDGTGGTDFDFDADFTIEFWINIHESISALLGIFGWVGSSDETTFQFYHKPSGNWHIGMQNHSHEFNKGVDALGVWHHIAIVREGKLITLYQDGVTVGTWYHAVGESSSGALISFAPDTALHIGRQGTNYGGFYLDDFRIVKGTAVYTSDFTVPTSRLTAITKTKLLIHSNQTIDSSDSNHLVTRTNAIPKSDQSKWGGSSWYFDGTTDCLTISDHDDWDFGDGNFTIEYWAKRTVTGATQFHFGWANDGTEDVGIRYSSDNVLRSYWRNSSNSSDNNNHQTITSTDWIHFAYVRNGSTVTIYIDGTADSTTINVGTDSIFDFDSKLSIGQLGEYTSSTFNGWIDDFRITKGVAVYTGNFTTPSGPLTTTWTEAGSGTPTSNGGYTSLTNVTTNSDSSKVKLLIHGDGGKFTDSSDGASDQSTAHDITPTGSYHSQGHGGIAPAMAWPANQKKHGSAGVLFDGNSDYFEIDPFESGVGTDIAFSMEFWFNQRSQNLQYIVDWRDGTPHNGYLYTNDNMTTMAFYGIGHSAETTINVTRSLNTWYHFLYSRHTDGTWGVYIDGIMKGQGTGDGESAPDHKLTLCKRGAGTDFYFDGYLDGIRFSTTDVTKDSTDPLYTGATHALASTSANNFNAGLPTKAYGTFNPSSINPITLTGTPGLGGGKVLFNNATLSGSTETTSALPSTLTISPAIDATNTTNIATISGDLSADAGTHSINIVARVSSDGAIGNIDPNRKQAYSHTITRTAGGAPTLFNARRYRGNSTIRSITGLGFQPDLVWTKGRDHAGQHIVFDSVRGVHKYIYTDADTSEQDNSGTENNQTLTRFNSDGYRLGKDASLEAINDDTSGGWGSGRPYIAWAWKAGGKPSAVNKRRTDNSSSETDLTAVNSTDGSANTYGKTNGDTDIQNVKQSVNSVGKFSITTWDQTSSESSQHICHGLGGTPDFVIWKRTNASNYWATWHSSLPDQNTACFIKFSDDSAKDANGDVIGVGNLHDDTSMYIGTNGATGGQSNAYVMYAWKSVAGVSKFGTYEGTGSSTFSAQNIGFQPKFLMIKNIEDSGTEWALHDSVRGMGYRVSPDTSAVEGYDSAAEGSQTLYPTITSTGFTYPASVVHARWNASGKTYIYAAFA